MLFKGCCCVSICLRYLFLFEKNVICDVYFLSFCLHIKPKMCTFVADSCLSALRSVLND